MANPTTRAISRLGIGCYRLALGVPEHEKSLYKALERQSDPRLNINLIDTSSNYSNGRSEQLIGKVLSHPRPNTLTRDEVIIATKFGYIQNENMRLLSEGVYSDVPEEEIVKYSPECYHCIHPVFMRDQLTRSLERLNTKTVDILFVHNPEYFLMSHVRDIKDIEVNVKQHQNILLDRLSILFEALEKEIEKGRIRSYGISSNSFSLKPSNAHFLPYEGLIKMATKAFETVRQRKQEEHERYRDNLTMLEKERSANVGTGATTKADSGNTGASKNATKPNSAPQPTTRTKHGLGFLQMPGNILEMEGILRTAKWAKGHGLRVFVNRPLNAMSPERGAVRLASYPAPQSPTYEEAYKRLRETLSNLGHQRENFALKMQRLQEMIDGLDASLRENKLSIIQLEGSAIRNQLHQELSRPMKTKPAPIPHSNSNNTTASGSGTSSDSTTPLIESTPDSPPVKKNQTVSKSTVVPNTQSIATTQELEGVIKALDKYIHAFHQQVRSQESKRVEKMLTGYGVDLGGGPIEKFALEYLLEHEQVDSVLLGMKREPYVDFARKTLQNIVQ
ncbi:hypothetical protein BGZ94_006757 [Podila epigama]|nr:hypothetical protein BGZ94_006757 [Podila epigama]